MRVGNEWGLGTSMGGLTRVLFTEQYPWQLGLIILAPYLFGLVVLIGVAVVVLRIVNRKKERNSEPRPPLGF